MFGPTRSLWPGAGPRGGRPWPAAGSPGTGRSDAERGAGPGIRGPKHGDRADHRAGRKSRGQVVGPCLRARETALILRNYSFSLSAWESTRTAFWELWNVPLGAQDRRKMLQTSNYSLVLSLQFLLLSYDLFVNSFSELLRMAPVIQLVLFIIQDIAVLFNIIIIFLMFFNTFVFQAGLVNLLFHKFKGTIILTAVYFALSISLHVWVMNLRWKNSNRFVWTDGLQTLFVFQRLAAVLYCYFYKQTAVRLGDPRFYQDSLWLRKEFMQVRRLP
ncbi:transmembrane protein 138 isoform X3 [Balaenoptera musculus]|uniref:Transmembrane protein 138 n=1 Tax=Balaenoptera musculus TaxID=9771 RepID=A0A8B8YF86_BALMU|nr:transmembrane protein 138 isoform X3 [Balaenoptera musculus]